MVSLPQLFSDPHYFPLTQVNTCSFFLFINRTQKMHLKLQLNKTMQNKNKDTRIGQNRRKRTKEELKKHM